MAQIIWSKRSAQQLERAIRYTREEQGVSYAYTVLDRILKATASLQSFPERGFMEPLLLHKKYLYRTIVVWSYKIIYRVDQDRVIVSRLFHTSRDPKKLRGV